MIYINRYREGSSWKTAVELLSIISFAQALPLLVLATQFLPSLTLPVNRTKTAPVKVPAVIGFGDSIIDPGNNNGLLTLVKANFPPYGIDFADHTPTGRFCNGKIPTDLLASKLGIKEYVPAYLGTKLGPEDLLTGVSFASSATGYDPLTPKIASVLSMDDELELFKEYVGKLKAIAGKERAHAIVSDSLYTIVAGTDDLANTYFTTPFRRKKYDIPSYVDLMINGAANFVEKLANLGARKIAFLGLPPIGCVPSQRTLGGGITRQCEPTRNQAARLYNSRVAVVLKQLENKLQGTRIVFLDIYDILLTIIQRPSAYGFEEATKGCCGTGALEVSILCNKFTPVTCPDPNKYVFWDSYHPTERGYEVLIDYLYQRYIQFLI